MADGTLTKTETSMSASSLTASSTEPPPPPPESTKTESSKLLENDTKVQQILNSDGAIDVLLNRLKQSLTTSEEFSKFIKKKAQIEDEHYNQLKKFASNIRASMKNNARNLKNDSLQFQMDKIIQFDETIYGVGNSYVTALNTMYDELTSLIGTVSRSRKLIKDEHKRKEKECIDAISAADKSKTKYNHLCEDLDRLKTSDPNKKSFSLKNKTIEQQEDELTRKVDTADQEYKLKVQVCKKLKDEILVIHRPNNTKKLKNLILELDIALNLQLQKYATWCENLIMNSGVLISPFQANKSSMKSMASSVDNEKDLYQYLLKNGTTLRNSLLVPVEYSIHPSLVKTKDIGKPFLNTTNTPANLKNAAATNRWNNNNNNGNNSNSSNTAASTVGLGAGHSKKASASFGTGSMVGGVLGAASVGSSTLAPSKSNDTNDLLSSSTGNTGAPLPPLPGQYSSLDPGSSQPPTPIMNGPKALSTFLQPTFGVSIEDVIQFAGVDNVPLVVRKCIEVIEAYGIDIVGIYRISSNQAQVNKLKEAIDSNFTNYLMIGKDIDPTNVYENEVFTVASLMKLYFSSLPEPLVTSAAAKSFIETVKSTDEHFIAKKLHQLVFGLPDGAYFTLRALMFHLNKIAEHEHENRMNAKSLAIIWGPVIFNDDSTSAQDLSYKSKVVEELMSIANDIFELDE
ncbi:RHO GTPase-activating protein RGD1 [Candida viswanathii]|uniref:RHO GTPase-activating protein RGD1 n=1 Tax=Candida viswanathii TaxID=5486 RepID=A0A367XSR6_9ASCO|nr:RHO GTPase-activating protein RGD1 [Candida viswanathii]